MSSEEPRRRRLATAARHARTLAPENLIERRMSRFLKEPPSIRVAAGVIVSATATVVIAAGILFRVLDHHEYPNIWIGMWLAVQTVTTVGYGDVAPKDHIGRIVAVFVMLEGIAFIAIITAAVTSTFVARAVEERGEDEADENAAQQARLDARFDDLASRLERLETMLGKLTNSSSQ